MSSHSTENNLPSKSGFTFSGVIVSATRRTVTAIATDTNLLQNEINLALPNKWEPLVVGDKVEILQDGLSSDYYKLTKHLKRTNVLRRAYEGRTKLIGANLDHIYLIMAPPPLWNNLFIDRALVAAANEGIQVTLICNKGDIEPEETINSLFQPYLTIAHSCLITTALDQDGLISLKIQLDSQSNQIVLLCGPSGVGKSTIINCLIPNVNQITQSVSKKTGQGRQTTTQSKAHRYTTSSGANLLILDSPGLQHFGLSHLSLTDMMKGFPEFSAKSLECRFIDCMHLGEDNCGVMNAVKHGEISQLRYNSYCHIISEIKQNRKL